AVSSTLYGHRFLTGEVGGSVTHQCFYSITPANKHYRKYWCKMEGGGICSTIISTTGYISKDHAGRVSLKDIPQNGTFMVTMSELKSSDTGTYRCGMGATNRDLYVRLNLVVSADAVTLGPTELVWGELQSSVTVLCPPGDTQGGKKRFWCKLGRTGCTLVADTDGYVGKSYQGRISITPQESSGAFKILINDLKKEDSGLYKCGTGRLSAQDGSRVVALQLTTASTLPKRPKFLSGTVGDSLSVKCHYDPSGSYEKQYWCRWKEASCELLVDTDGFVHESYKGRIQIASSNRENGTYTVVMSHLREEDAGWYWCGARNGHVERTSSVKLLIQKGNLAPSITPTQRSIRGLTFSMGTVTKSSSTPTQRGIRGLTFTMGTITKSSSTPTQRGITDLRYTTVTDTESSSTLLPTASPSTSVTSSGEIFHKSSSGESRLLPFVLPALILLAVIIFVLTRVKLQREMGEERSAVGTLEAVSDQAGLNPVKEPTGESPAAGKVHGCGTDSGNCRWVFSGTGTDR
ncbi:PIGR protein, partial [Bucorvus abyssinicus]|nr:PIGR protein [Bucorvus abyssinicus]